VILLATIVRFFWTARHPKYHPPEVSARQSAS
jgi:hypothetical protein